MLASCCFGEGESVHKPREWIMTSQAIFNGTFVKYEDGFVYIKLEDGMVRKFPKAMGASESIGYVQNLICKFPVIRKSQISAENKLLIDLSVDDLGTGPLGKWVNRGELGGAFHALNNPPNVKMVAGRKCVYFDSSAWAVPMDFQAMAADFYAPKVLDTDGPFTVAAWLYNPSPLGIDGTRETFLSWHYMGGDSGTQFGYGAEGRYAHEKGLNGGAYEGPLGGLGLPDSCWPELNRWHHIAYVFTGGRDGKFQIYVNGKLGSERMFNRSITNLPATEIGKTEVTLNADLFLRDGKPVKVTAFIGESDGKHWRWPEKWSQIIDMGMQSTPKISTKVTGLKPGTKYYYRFYLATDNLPTGNETRWSEEAGMLVTAGEDGTPGRMLPATEDKVVFLGCNWGINWVWDTKPNWLYTGGIGDLKFYTKALSEREIRNLYGSQSAYEPIPAPGSETEDTGVTLAWKPGASGVESYNVYLSEDKAAVENRQASARKTSTNETTFDPGKLEVGKTYYWCVDQEYKDGIADTSGHRGDVWSFTAYSAKATVPKPANGAQDAILYTSRLSWKPSKLAEKQKVYFSTDRRAVEQGTTKLVSHILPKDATSFILREVWGDMVLEYDRTYYWRVEQMDADGKTIAKGDVWQFKIDQYFEPEFDGLVSEPFPTAIKQDGYYGKIMECYGQPVVAAADCPEDAMRLCSYTVGKYLKKRPDVAQVMEALNCGSHLDYGDRGWGWNEFAMACYGNVRTFQLDPTFYWGINIMMHEMGHQYHMFGMEQTDNDFRGRLWDLYRLSKAEGRWVGDYGANNPWEYIAVVASAYCSDGSEDDVICRRETLRRTDPAMFHLLSDYWPGDLVVDLQPLKGIKTDASGKVAAWDNQGGLEYWGKFGLKRYPETVGSFIPRGAPKLGTVKGVSAVTFGGSDAFVWDKTTREFLVGNQAWSVELWANKATMGTGNQIMLSWGPPGQGVQFSWPQFRTAPSLGAWHHVVYTFKGGGLADGKGAYRVYVNGKLDQSGEFKLDIPGEQPIVVGGMLKNGSIVDGFTGALAHVRVYDYDLGELQLKGHYDAEKAFYAPEPVNVAGTLLVDLDARQLAPCPINETRPLYPASTGRDWVRSWYNRGVMAGKMANDKRAPEGSDPRLKTVAGVTALEFLGNDRMVSTFTPSDMMIKSQALTLETWAYRSAKDKSGTILQWGDIELVGNQIQPGAWRHVALVMGKADSKLYVDGKLVSTGKAIAVPSELARLHFGARWNGANWSNYFDGAISQVRVQSGALSPQQITLNFGGSQYQFASHPSPAVGGKVVAERKPVLAWSPGVRVARADYDVYLSADQSKVASAVKGDAAYLGRAASGKLAPSLKPGTTYYWRVDGLDASGKTIAKGKVWSFATSGGLLVDLDASKLQPGKVETWTNAGRAGGKFTKGSYGDQSGPVVVTVDGRKCLDFTGAKCLVSSFTAPKGITGGGDFTVSVWAYKRWFNEVETMLSWGSFADGTAEFIYGTGKNNGAFKNSKGFSTGYTGPYEAPDLYKNNSPMMLFWQHITYTYSGGPEGTLKIYVNGILNTEKKASLTIAENGKIALGAVLEADGRPVYPFSGFMSDIMVYDKALDIDEVKFVYDGSGRKPDDSQLLVKLTSEGLANGKLTSWKNQGTAGGAFGLPQRQPTEPVAGTVAGRSAVTFDGRSTFMQSSIPAPASVTWRNPFSVEMWVYNPTVDWAETVFSLAPRQAFTSTMLEDYIRRAAEFRYGNGGDRAPAAFCTGWDYHNTGWKDGKHPEAGKWHHIAYVCDGQRQGTLTIYVNGVPVHTREWFTLATTTSLPMFLGTAWNTETGTSEMFSGSISSLKVYDYARTENEVRAASQSK